jgi:membrane carboxypeptidase/penicillin-binding protein
VIFAARARGKQVIKPEVAYAATKVMEGVITKGTGWRADIGRPAAGKTGTSQNYRDAWFVGYTPQLVTSVWVGHKTERTIVVDGKKGFGGTLAAPIWSSFMKAALKGQAKKKFAKADEPDYDSDKFDIPVSDETKNAKYRKTIKVYVYSDLPKGTIIDKSTNSKGVTTITISKGKKPSSSKKKKSDDSGDKSDGDSDEGSDDTSSTP